MNKYAFIMEKPEREFKKNKTDDSKDKKLNFRQILAFNLIFASLLALSVLIFKLEKVSTIDFLGLHDTNSKNNKWVKGKFA